MHSISFLNGRSPSFSISYSYSSNGGTALSTSTPVYGYPFRPVFFLLPVSPRYKKILASSYNQTSGLVKSEFKPDAGLSLAISFADQINKVHAAYLCFRSIQVKPDCLVCCSSSLRSVLTSIRLTPFKKALTTRARYRSLQLSFFWSLERL